MIFSMSATRPVFLVLFAVSAGGLAGCFDEASEPEQRVERGPRKIFAPPTPDLGVRSAPATADAVSEDALQALAVVEAPEPEPAPEEALPARRAPRRRRTAPSEPAEPLPEDVGPGQLSDGAFQSIINDWTGMKRCLASTTSRLGPSSGALRLAFTIRGDGQVVKSRVVETSNAAAKELAPCVERRARRLKFPAFAAAGDEVEKTAKFVF